MKKEKMIMEIIENTDEDELKDYAEMYLRLIPDEMIKEEYEKKCVFNED